MTFAQTTKANARAAFREKATGTVIRLAEHPEGLSVEAIVAELQADVDEVAVESFRAAFLAARGASIGAVLLDYLENNLDVSDRVLAERHGMDRSTVSKAIAGLRRNLGLPQVARLPRNRKKEKARLELREAA